MKSVTNPELKYEQNSFPLLKKQNHFDTTIIGNNAILKFRLGSNKKFGDFVCLFKNKS